MQNEHTDPIVLTGSSEDYLIAIKEIGAEKGGAARQIEISEHLGFSKPSALRGVKVLAQKGLVRVVRSEQNCKDIYLTETGRVLANRLLEKRRVAAGILVSLGVPEKDAKAEARLWMHGLSDETAAAMKSFLPRI